MSLSVVVACIAFGFHLLLRVKSPPNSDSFRDSPEVGTNLCFYFILFQFFETGFLYVVLAVLELSVGWP